MSVTLPTNLIKRVLKRAAGEMSAATPAFARPRPPICIFYWHRISNLAFVDKSIDDWNTPPAVFRRQIAALAEMGEFVPLTSLSQCLNDDPARRRPLICLTFDDGFANFVEEALPVLEEYQAPATMFLVTGAIDGSTPMHHDRWAARNRDRAPADAWRPMNRRELDRCLERGRVTFGGHSHRHLNGLKCSESELAEEAGLSREMLVKWFGEEHSRTYAYPYGCTRVGHVPPAYRRAVADAGYSLAVTTNLGHVTAADDPFLLPRLEAHAVDTPRIIRAKARGAISPYRLVDRFRSGERSGR